MVCLRRSRLPAIGADAPLGRSHHRHQRVHASVPRAGPRIEAERIGRKTVVHNYGHGGSGWSLSWGAAEQALRLVRAADPAARALAVIGCGAIGLTTALVAQRAGLRVRIYARERLPDVRSFYAAGVWSPDSRVCTSEHATADFKRRWEDMARTSFRRYQTLLGLPGEPIEWRDGYVLGRALRSTCRLCRSA